MKSDKPFQKLLVCGIIFSVIGVSLCLIFVEPKNYSQIKFGRIFFVSFIPVTFAAVWTFFSKRKWSWFRFLVITLLALVFCFVVIANFSESFNQHSWPVPKIAFKHQPSASWVLETGKPIINKNGQPIGSQLLLQNKDRKRMVWIEAWNSQDSFESNVESSKQLMETRARKSGFEIKENKFFYDQTNKKIVKQNLRTQKGEVTNNIICKYWMEELNHEQIILNSIAKGQSIEIINDDEIAEIISSIVIQ